jgi:parallel beta-helix repeat protein
VCALKAAPGAAVLINSLSPAHRHSGLIEVENFDGVTSYWVIDGFELAGAPRSGVDLRFTDHVTVRNCRVHNSGRTGIFLAFSYYPLIQDNESYSNGEHGIYQSNSGDYPTIRRNRLHHNYAAGIHMNGDRYFTPGDGIISFAVVEKNVIWENGTGGGSAINCDGVSDSIIRNNLLYANHASGISLYAIDGAEGSSRNRVYNNTIVQASNARWCINIPASSEGQPNPAGNVVKNNILYHPSSSRGSITTYSSSASGFESDYNVVVSRFSIDEGSTVISLAQWQGLGYDRNSIVALPDQLFVNAAGSDYHLKSASPAIDAGAALAEVSDDLDGTARPQSTRYDIGCYEAQGSTPIPPPIADFSASPSSGAAPLTVQFTDQSTGASIWAWDFGDGATSTLPSPAHTYRSAASYNVTLRVTNSSGEDVETRPGYITVTAPGPRDYFCGAATVDRGRVRSGNHTSVHSSDDAYLLIRSVNLDGAHGDVVTYTFATELASLSSLVISLESRCALVPQRQRVMVFNVSTGAWDVVDDRRIDAAGEVNTTVTVANPSRYISASGDVRVQVRTGDVTTLRWKHWIDLVKVTAAP